MLGWKKQIKDFIVTGDIHGNIIPIYDFSTMYDTNTTALIILGDVGLNFYLNTTDTKKKQAVQNMKCLVYCVRGNHEERPENISTMIQTYDKIVKGNVWYEKEYPNIRYLQDGGIYYFGDYRSLILGGAYSIDKNYRLNSAKARGIDINTQWTGWFKDEQLTLEEKEIISQKVKGQTFDFIFSHTCPYDWQPFDLFIPGVDQTTVDNSMELWLNELKDQIKWRCGWLFGHFHNDRDISYKVKMLYRSFQSLEELSNQE